MGYLYDNDEIRRKLVDQFKWKNFKQDMTSDVVYGSSFAPPDAADVQPKS